MADVPLSSMDTPSVEGDLAYSAPLSCYHCGLPVMVAGEFTHCINHVEQEFCCPGCQAIASAIDEGGLGSFYAYRSELSQRPEMIVDDFSIYDELSIQAPFVSRIDDCCSSANLLLEGITCAACVWLIEQHLEQLPGLQRIRVNSVTHQCVVSWDHTQQHLSVIMAALAHIGYRPQPALAADQKLHQQQLQRASLMRLAVAAFGMMQVGMVAIALYAGALQGMDQQWQWLLRWTSLLVATPVVLFSAKPFWQSAWRSLRNRHLTMDVPVSLAILLAYFASAWATVYNAGEVYFDSVSMFTFFLLLGRHLEMRARLHNWQMTGNMTRLLPMTALRVSTPSNTDTSNQQSMTTVSLEQVVVGDCLRVGSGDTLPCDGVVIDGHSAVIEALITGEAEPVEKVIGDAVIAGTLNTDGSLLIKVTAVGSQTRLSTIEQLVSQAQQEKPALQIIADKLSSYFVGFVLLVSLGVLGFWLLHSPTHAFWVMLSVLVVTCPCALSLATPAALTAAVAALRQCGLLVLKGHVIEALCRIDTVVFDKTGTLTYGKPQVTQVIPIDASGVDDDQILALAAALEEGSNHPIAQAFIDYQGRYRASDLCVVTGAGVEGVIDQQHYRLGKPSFAIGDDVMLDAPSKGQWLLLAKDQAPIAWIGLRDQLRESSLETVKALRQCGINVEILSGDTHNVVSDMASHLGGIHYRADNTPEMKLAYIRKLQRTQHVLMVGDGINDVPVLATADVSIAMDTASDFAQAKADNVLLNGNLSTLVKAMIVARRCRRIIKQNLSWALLYNILALPLAAAGYVPPYLAAIGMSLSSLIVVLNAMRLYRV